jgi:cell division protein FtsL
MIVLIITALVSLVLLAIAYVIALLASYDVERQGNDIMAIISEECDRDFGQLYSQIIGK